MAPIAALLPAFMAALWSGLVACFRWLVGHAHVVKIVGVCVLIVAAFKAGRYAYALLVSSATSYLSQISQAAPHNTSSPAFSLLAKANYCLPLSETFALLAVYVTFAGLCLGLKFLIAAYKAVPFKSA